MKKEITEEEYFQLEGLFCIARQAKKQIDSCEHSAASILRSDDKEDDYEAAECIFGYIFEDKKYTVRELLAKAGVQIKKKKGV